MLGETSVEAWHNSGSGSPPVTRIEQQVFDVGLKGLHAVTNTDNFMYWLSDDLHVYRVSGGARETVSSSAMSNEFESYATTSDCESWSFVFQGQSFICFNFPSAGKSWCLNEELGENGWFELGQKVNLEYWPYSDPVRIYGKTLLGSTSGSVASLEKDVYTYEGETIPRIRVTSSLSSQVLGQKDKEIRISRLKLVLESGVGLLSGQGEDPIIRLEASIDGGRSWTELSWIKTGRLGDYRMEITSDFFLTCFDCVFRLTQTDPVLLNIYSGSIDMKLTGRK